MYEIEFAPRARQDLIKIKRYLEEQFSHQIAIECMNKIMSQIENLASFPLVGKPLSNVINVHSDYLHLVIERNYVWYRLKPERVMIIREIDHRQDFIKQIFG